MVRSKIFLLCSVCFRLLVIIGLVSLPSQENVRADWFQIEENRNILQTTTAVYKLPFRYGTQYSISRGGTKHNNSYDFATGKEGVEIFASIGGTVEAVVESNDCSNCGFEHNNTIRIKQDDGTYGFYLHLKKDGVVVEKGWEIKQGQLLGYSGNTGASTGPHIHYNVSSDSGNKNRILIRFIEAPKSNPDLSGENFLSPLSQNAFCPVPQNDKVILFTKSKGSLPDACGGLDKDGYIELKPGGGTDLSMPIGSISFPPCRSESSAPFDPSKQYKIKSIFNELYLDVGGNLANDNAAVIQWHFNGESNQRWKFEPITGYTNRYLIHAMNSEKCLSVSYFKKAIQFTCDKTNTNLHWEIIEKNGSYIIKNMGQHGNVVLDVPGWSKKPGDQIILFSQQENQENQLWEIKEAYDYVLQIKIDENNQSWFYSSVDSIQDSEFIRKIKSGAHYSYNLYNFYQICSSQNSLDPFSSKEPACIVNHPPNIPGIVAPVNNSSTLNIAPDLCWQGQGDPDNNPLEYKVEIYDSPINLSSAWMKNTCWRPASLDGQFHTYQWRVKARDPLLAESGWSQTRTFTVESPNRPPTISFSTANGDPFSSGIVYSRDTNWTFTGTASDYEGDLTRIEWRCGVYRDNCGTVSAHNGTNSWNHTQSGLSGRNDIYFVAYDGYGNNTPSRHLDLRIDLASPVTTIGLNSESEPSKWPNWFTGPVTVNLKGIDRGTGQAISEVNQLLYRVDGGTWQTVSGASVNFIVSSDGSHTIDYYAVDAVGNAETARSAVFQIDQTPPGNPDSITDNNGAINNVWQNTHNIPQLKWNEAADATSGLWGYQLYFGEDATGTGLINFPASAAREWTPQPAGVHTGTYYLRGRTRDIAGNWSAWTTWFTYRYDGTPPENPTQVTHAAGITNTLWQNATNSANFSWPVPNDEGSGLLGYYVAWSTNPTATGTLLLTNNTYLDLTPLCGENEACIGYLRLRSVDNVGNLANDWNTVFEMRYDNAPPVLDFTFENGATQTHQTLITINLDADDQGSGVRSMRLSNDNHHWTDWEAYRTTRPGWPIAAISRQTWPVYVQVQDWVGLSSEIEVRSIYLDVNQAQPQSANFRLFDTGMNMGVGTYTSSIYSGRGTTGQTADAGLITSSHFQIWNGFEAGSQAVPIAQPGHDDFNHINGVFAAGNTVTGMVSASYQLLGVFGETGLPNLTSIVSGHFQHQPGFLAAQPSPLAPVTPPAPGPVPDPLPVITCKSPSVTINAKAAFTNTLNVSLALCGPQVAEMKISNDPAFAGAVWQPFLDTVSWTLRDEGAQVSPRFVYVMFKDTTGIVHGAYFDDVIYDPNVPDSEVLFSDDVAESGAMTTIRVAKGFTPGGEADTRTAYEEIPVIAAQPDGSVKLFIKGYDDNSGIAEVQISEDPTFTGADWIPFSMVQFWTPESPDDGRKVAYIRTRDQAGNIAAVNQVDFVFDANGPYGWPSFEQHILSTQAISVTVYMGAFDGTMNEDYGEENPPVNFYEGVVEDMRISNDPLFMDTAWQPYADTYELPVSVSDASRTIYVQYRDYAGNVSEIHSNSYEFDAIGPTVQVDASYGATLTRTLSIYAYDDLSGLSEIRLSSDPLMAEDNTVTLPFSETIDWQFDENRIVWIQVSDEVGNWSEIYPVYAYEIEAAIHDVFLPMILSVAQAVTP